MRLGRIFFRFGVVTWIRIRFLKMQKKNIHKVRLNASKQIEYLVLLSSSMMYLD